MTFPSNARDTRPEGPHFATPRCDTCGGERLYACHVCGRCVERANREPIRDLKVPARFAQSLADDVRDHLRRFPQTLPTCAAALEQMADEAMTEAWEGVER